MNESINSMPLRHGGDLNRAVALYGGESIDWLDLSTGISPWTYPIAALDDSLWRRLPEEPTSLIVTAADYYECQTSALGLTPGSQLAIRLLPTFLKSPTTVAIPEIGYREHAIAWQRANHTVLTYKGLEQLKSLIADQRVQHAVIINPNNPSCDAFSPDAMLKIANRLNGLLVIDEAFADLDNQNSLCADSYHSQASNLIIFRSIGKFFGLAGARVGFVISHHETGKQLAQMFQPWPINALAQHITELALADVRWQHKQRQRIHAQAGLMGAQLDHLVAESSTTFKVKSHGLFSTLFGDHKSLTKLHRQLAQQRIWTRLGDANQQHQNWLRLSLPGDQITKLNDVIHSITKPS